MTEYTQQRDSPRVVLPGYGTGWRSGPAAPARPAPGHGPGSRLGQGGDLSEDDYQVLRGEEAPPDSAFVTSLWALVTLGGEPVAFISPDEVRNLDADRPVAAFLDDLDAAYVADIGVPSLFFRVWLGRPHVTQGRVVILSRDFAGTAGLRVGLRAGLRTVLTEFGATRCAYGIITGAGQVCSSCICEP